jgi:hypothetical protein
MEKRRLGISPIVATVLIVAATLIAFAAVAGYVFGILGSGSSTANVSVVSVSINSGLASGSAVVTLTNTGTAGTSATGITITYSGTTCSLGVAGNTQVNSGSTTVFVNNGAGTCVASTTSTPFTGYVSMSNGEEATFAGTFT